MLIVESVVDVDVVEVDVVEVDTATGSVVGAVVSAEPLVHADSVRTRATKTTLRMRTPSTCHDMIAAPRSNVNRFVLSRPWTKARFIDWTTAQHRERHDVSRCLPTIAERP